MREKLTVIKVGGKIVEEDETFNYDDIKYTKYLISFK